MKGARNIILNVSMRLFAHKGYAGCSIREICQAAGITKPVLYYHFRSKEHLYQELMLDIFNQTKKNYLQLSTFRGSLRNRLVQYVSSEFQNCRREPDSVRLLFRMMFSPEGEYPRFNFVAEFKNERDIIAGFIKEQMPKKSPDDPELISSALMGMMLMQILEFFFTRKRTLTRRTAERLIDLLLSPSSPTRNTKPIGMRRGGRS
jgi:TetR/AcrR family transcriptional regulator